MAKEWTDEEVQAEISAAVAIVREDRFEAFARGLLSSTPSGDPPKDPPNPKSPPRTDPPEPKTRKSLWWGEQSE